MQIGLSIGFVVGAIGGTIALVLVRTLTTASISDTKSVVTLVGQFLTLPGFLVGASFLAGGPWFFSQQDLHEIRPHYFLALAGTFFIMMAWPIYKWILRLGRELGESPR